MSENSICPNREGTNAAHCDHATGQVFTSYPPQTQYRCCYCGRVRTPEPLPMGGSFTAPRKEDHGPYFPETRVIF
jgi:hypothetical protein